MNDELTAITIETALTGRYEIIGFGELHIHSIKLILVKESKSDEYLKPICVMYTIDKDPVIFTNFGANWQLTLSELTIERLQKLFFTELYSHMTVFTHYHDNYAVTMMYKLNLPVKERKLFILCRPYSDNTCQVTVGAEYNNRPEKRFGTATFKINDNIYLNELMKKAKTCAAEMLENNAAADKYFKQYMFFNRYGKLCGK